MQATIGHRGNIRDKPSPVRYNGDGGSVQKKKCKCDRACRIMAPNPRQMNQHPSQITCQRGVFSAILLLAIAIEFSGCCCPSWGPSSFPGPDSCAGIAKLDPATTTGIRARWIAEKDIPCLGRLQQANSNLKRNGQVGFWHFTNTSRSTARPPINAADRSFRFRL